VKFPEKLFHFGKSRDLTDFIPYGVISFGIASGFLNEQLTKGQRDDEMKRTASPPMDRTTVLAGGKLENATPLSNVFSFTVKLGIQRPYFMKCFSVGFSNEM
jgi:hypothetical protein